MKGKEFMIENNKKILEKNKSSLLYSIRFFSCLVVLSHVLLMGMQAAPTEARQLSGNPSNYLDLVRSLQPGDTLVLEPGIYNDPNDAPGLPFFGVRGEPGNPIIVMGAEGQPRPVFQGRSTHNTVRFDDASYIEIRHIEIDGRDLGGDGINAQGISHHITLEDIIIDGVGNSQGTVGISTNRAPTWDWVIRHNIIRNAGTGMYLGNSPGNNPFVRGIIEYNLIEDTIGYNMQIKHQNPRPTNIGMPTGLSKTIIRHNVFTKSGNSIGSSPRPNLLVGHFPLSGPGVDDVYEIYGNFFYQNPTEALFQGEGNVALYNNLFFISTGNAIHIQPHNDIPREIRIFNNTVVASGRGIRVTGGSSNATQKVIGNAVFAATPIQAANTTDNITDAYSAASIYLDNPFASFGQFNLYPKEGELTGSPLDTTDIQNFTQWNLDFNGVIHSGQFRGAYAGDGVNPGWLPKLERKPIPNITDTTPPAAPTNLRIQ